MRKIYGIGETVLDIIFKNGSPQAAKPGGSVLNSMVSLGRMGLPVSFISEYGNDDVGILIDRFLKDNGVDTSLICKHDFERTSIALAFLDENNDAHYSFYKVTPERRLDTGFPEVQKNDIVQCGSFYSVGKEIRPRFTRFIAGAVESGALVLYDPNFRKSHVSELEMLAPMIIENMQMASIVRGSDEDFRNIFGAATPDDAWTAVKDYCKCLVYTTSANSVFVRTDSFAGDFPVKKINPVSTIGAGDNFNAGMVAAIFNDGINREDLPEIGERQWRKIVSSGVEFASEVCMSYENYISKEFAAKIR